MKRRDTIIVAVLINAGLLLILFATAMHGDKDEVKNTASQIVMAVPEETVTVPQENLPLNPTDEVDQVLSHWSAAPTSSTPLIPQVMDSKTFIEPQVTASAPVKPTVETAKPSQIVEVTVKQGDVLERIAKANGTTVQDIMRVNHLPNSRLKIGQILKIPVAGQERTTKPKVIAKSDAKKNAETTSRFYTMKKGDSLWSIATKNHMKVEDLLRINHLDEDKARRLKPGDQIMIR